MHIFFPFFICRTALASTLTLFGLENYEINEFFKVCNYCSQAVLPYKVFQASTMTFIQVTQIRIPLLHTTFAIKDNVVILNYDFSSVLSVV